MADSIVKRECTRCLAAKPLAEFYKRPDKGIYASWCRECSKEYWRERYKNLPADKLEKKRASTREYQRRRKQTDPVHKAQQIAAVRAFWDRLSPDERERLNRRKKLLRRYGLSLEQWEAMKAEQKGLCAICGEEPQTERGYHVDHCHKTGKVRGLLCLRCNTGLGWLERMTDRMDRVSAYLKAAENV